MIARERGGHDEVRDAAFSLMAISYLVTGISMFSPRCTTASRLYETFATATPNARAHGAGEYARTWFKQIRRCRNAVVAARHITTKKPAC